MIDPPPIADPAAALAYTHEWFEWNSGWAPPDPATLADWLADDLCRCPDDCLIAPASWCEHGLATWDLILDAADAEHAGVRTAMHPASPTSTRPGPSKVAAVSDATDEDAAVVEAAAEATDTDPNDTVAVDVADDFPDRAADADNFEQTLLADLKVPHVAHVLEHDVPPPHVLTPIDRFDQAVDRAFDVLRGTEPADRFFYSLSELADFSLLWLLIASSKGAASNKQLPNAVRVGTVLAVESLLVNGVIKSAFKRERPVMEAERPYHLRVPLTTSFPSGHSSAAMVAAILLSEHSRAKPLYFGLGVLVASSRVYVRIHHASDVVGGLAVGLALGTIAKKAWPLDRGPIGTRTVRRRFAR